MHSSELLPFQPALFILLALGTQPGLEPMLSDSELRRIAALGYSRSKRLMRRKREPGFGMCEMNTWVKA